MGATVTLWPAAKVVPIAIKTTRTPLRPHA
jgi:hypothetical protein